jgi:hypothetical protein
VPTFPGAWPAADYSLSEEVFIAMADLLVPRAVAYSAGLLNYFFRGRLDVQVETYNRSDVILKYRNLTTDDTLYSQNGDSQLVVTYQYKDNGQTVFGVSNRVSVASPDDVAPGAVSAQTYTFTFSPAIPQGAEELELRLVFHGKLGNEDDAIAVGMEPMTSPGFLVMPSVTPADGIVGTRHIYMSDGVWKLSPETGFLYGNVDWKGARGDVLTFDGPPSRYFYPETVYGYSGKIFRRGVLWAQIPRGQVVGVGIRQLQSQRQLIAISFDRFGFDLRVYGRTFADSYPNDDNYDQVVNPLGWKLLYQADFGASGLAPSTPVFMNASGTEAQGVFGLWDTDQRFLNIIKVSLSESDVSHTETQATGSYTRTRTTANTTSREFSVGPGQDNGDCTAVSECTEWGSCGGSDGYCLRSDLQYSRPQSITFLKNTDQSTNEPTVWLVDYSGDREVKVEIRHDRYSEQHSSERLVANEYTYFNLGCGSGTSQANQSDSATFTGQDTLNDETHFEAGIFNLSLSKITHTTRWVESTIRQVENIQAIVLAFDGAIDSARDKTETSRRILALDARSAFAIFGESESTSSVIEQASDTPCCIKSQQLSVSQTDQDTDTYRLLATVGGKRVTVAETQSSTTVNSNYLKFLPGFTILGDCPDTSTVETNNSWTYEGDASMGWDFVHPQSLLSNAPQGASVDQYGHVLASQTKWLEQNDGSYVSQGIWNYLTDGDPASLFGITDPQVSFWPIGLY